MITLTNKPDVALKKLVNDILFGLINDDYGIILGKLSHEYGKWTKERIRSELLKATNGKQVSEFLSIKITDPPVVSGDEAMYEYRQRIPIDGEWSNAFVVLRLHRKNKPLYALELVGFS